MTLVVGKNAVALRMGAPPYRRKLDQAIRVVAELDRRGAKPDSIMLDNEARPDRVVVRMRWESPIRRRQERAFVL